MPAVSAERAPLAPDPVAAILPSPALRTARRVFLGALLSTTAMTLFWAIVMALGPARAPVFGKYKADKEALGRIAFYFLFFSVLWGAIWYGIRKLLLRKFVGMSKEDVRAVFTSRLHGPFDLKGLLARYSERRIRIT